MKTVCEVNQCAGCMACVDVCPKNAIEIKDELSHYNAVIREDKCINCNACHKVCQNNHPAKTKQPLKWYQGWANDSELRNNCSSGGLATAISEAFIKNGGKVCSCTFDSGRFIFKTASKAEELKQFSGSKYVKSDPKGAYRAVKDMLKRGEKVLFIGLPCQVSAMKNFIGESLCDALYTIDLICHGTPSPKVLEIFLSQYGYSIETIRNIQFRKNTKFRIYNDYKSIITDGVIDRYSLAFLECLTYTDNCYRCAYAQKERVSDLTLGDSWGTALPVNETAKGISLVLCQSSKGDELLKAANICLKDVDIDRAVENNHQLKHPSIEPKGRKRFFEGLNRDNFNKRVFRQLPKHCLRQEVKQVLIKVGLLKYWGGVS